MVGGFQVVSWWFPYQNEYQIIYFPLRGYPLSHPKMGHDSPGFLLAEAVNMKKVNWSVREHSRPGLPEVRQWPWLGKKHLQKVGESVRQKRDPSGRFRSLQTGCILEICFRKPNDNSLLWVKIVPYATPRRGMNISASPTTRRGRCGRCGRCGRYRW